MADSPVLRSVSLEHALTLLAILCLGRIVWIAVYRLYFHSLSKYPGPMMARLTDFYMISASIQCKSTYLRHELHQRYGDVVRVGPNELSFCDAASIKDIYGQSSEPCPKAPYFYEGFTLTGTSSVFSATDRNTHARMRRLLSHGFSERGVLQFQNEIVETVELFLNVLASFTHCGSVNIHDLVHSLFLDTTSVLSFAKSFHTIRDGKANQGARDIDTYFSVSPLYGIFPLAKHLPFGMFGAAKDARSRIITYVQTCIDDFRHRLASGTSQAGLLRLMIEATDDVESEKDGKIAVAFSDKELIENAVLFIVAGSGTTATTLLYLIYELGKRSDQLKRLEGEIRSAFPDPNVFPDLETARELPYLNAVIQETLRLRGPIPTVAPRLSPGKSIAGEFIPSGVIVSNLAYSTQRDPAIFIDPYAFSPDRWLTDVTSGMKVMNRPFNTGPRNCLGMHLARVQLLLTICALYSRFEVTLDETLTTQEKMIMRDQGVMTLSGKQLWISLRSRTK